MDKGTVKSILKQEGLVAFASLYVSGLLSEKTFLQIVEYYKKVKNNA
jgi:hypothetical protein